MAGKKTDETCYSEPIPKWLKRKAVVENKLKEHERRIWFASGVGKTSILLIGFDLNNFDIASNIETSYWK